MNDRAILQSVDTAFGRRWALWDPVTNVTLFPTAYQIRAMYEMTPDEGAAVVAPVPRSSMEDAR